MTNPENQTAGGSEQYPEHPSVRRAEWHITYDEKDAYERSATGTLTVEGDEGVLEIRARYRADPDLLGNDVLREELGFWNNDDSPEKGDVPRETATAEWELERAESLSHDEYVRVCESCLTVDPTEIYDEYSHLL